MAGFKLCGWLLVAWPLVPGAGMMKAEEGVSWRVGPWGWDGAGGSACRLEMRSQKRFAALRAGCTGGAVSPQSESFFKDNVQKVKNVHDLETSGKRWSVLIEEGGGHWEEVCES